MLQAYDLHFTRNSLFELFCCRLKILHLPKTACSSYFVAGLRFYILPKTKQPVRAILLQAYDLHFTRNSLFELFCCRLKILYLPKTACSSYFAAGLRFYILPKTKQPVRAILLQAYDLHFTQNSLFELFCCRLKILHLPKTACSSYFAAGLRFYILPKTKQPVRAILLQAYDLHFTQNSLFELFCCRLKILHLPKTACSSYFAAGLRFYILPKTKQPVRAILLQAYDLHFTRNSLFELFFCRLKILHLPKTACSSYFVAGLRFYILPKTKQPVRAILLQAYDLHFTRNSLFELVCCRPTILHFTQNKTACSSYFVAGLRFYILPETK